MSLQLYLLCVIPRSSVDATTAVVIVIATLWDCCREADASVIASSLSETLDHTVASCLLVL